MAGRHSIIGDVRGLGLQIGVELVLDRDEKTAATDAAERILYSALEKGLSMKITMGNILSLTPPLTITTEEMDAALTIIDECLAEAGGD